MENEHCGAKEKENKIVVTGTKKGGQCSSLKSASFDDVRKSIHDDASPKYYLIYLMGRLLLWDRNKYCAFAV
jgi:hypothetical protein